MKTVTALARHDVLCPGRWWPDAGQGPRQTDAACANRDGGATTTLETKETPIMKTLCSTLLTIGLVFGFASAALAQSQPWNQVITGQGRFTVLSQFNNQAVFDKETGLVWEQAPHAQETSWGGAQHYCAELALGNRRGWRLPSVQELESLTDATQSNPTLPVGHPFSNVDPDIFYWSATADTFDSGSVWVMTFADGKTAFGPRCAPGTGCGAPRIPISVWCVRAGSGTDAQ
jgi:uncharacterized protein DUF1566